MAGEFYPAAQQLQYPDMLAAYVRGQQAPLDTQLKQQAVTEGALKMDQLRQIMNLSRQLSGQGAQNQGGPSGGIQNGPQGQVSSQPPSPSGSFDGSVGPPVNTMMALDVLQGRDPLKSAQFAQEYQLKQAQLQAQGPLNLAESVISSPNAHRIVMNNPSLLQGWRQYAPKLGLDPSDPTQLTPENAKAAATLFYNDVAGRAGLPPKAMPAPMQDIPGGQVDPSSGKRTFESLHSVIGPNGQPVLLPESQAAGKTPFNPSVFGAGSISDQSKEFAYQNWLATGELPKGFARNSAMQAQMMNYVSQRAAVEGNSAASGAAKAQAYKAAQSVVKGFESGAESKTINGINTAVQHMAALDPLVDALGTGDIKAFNKVSNAFKQQTGNPAPTNYAALKEFVGGEVAKAVLPGGGGEAERQALTAPLNAANSPEAIKQAVQTIKTALAGKTEALRNQWDVGTNGTQGNFDKFLLPETKKALGLSNAAPSAHPAGVQALLDKYK